MKARLDLVSHYADTRPADVARRVESLTPGDAVVLLSALPPATTAELLPHLAPGLASHIVAELPPGVASAVTGAMRLGVAAGLLRRLEPAAVVRILGALPADTSKRIVALLAYGPETAGGVMDPQVLTVPDAATVADARAVLEANPSHLSYYVYVIDAEHRLAGVCALEELLQADRSAKLSAIARPSVTWLAADAPLASVFAHPGWRTLDALPVVDHEQRFLGVLRHRHMRQLQENEAPTLGDDGAVQAVMALGEMYWLGLCGLLQGVAAIAATPVPPGDAA